jgi:hypothetical protein
MRAVGLSDLDVATRALLAVSRTDWDTVATRMIAKAHTADLWRKRHGVAHPGGGTGSLYAQAVLLPTCASSECTPQYCAALAAILGALAEWRRRGNHLL